MPVGSLAAGYEMDLGEERVKGSRSTVVLGRRGRIDGDGKPFGWNLRAYIDTDTP